MSRPSLLVSLLVGDADSKRNRQACMASVESLLASDCMERFSVRLWTLCIGKTPGAGELSSWLRSVGFIVFAATRPVGIGAGRNFLLRDAINDCGPVDFVCEWHDDMVAPRVWAAPILAHLESNSRLGNLGAAFFSSRGYWKSEALDLDLTRPTDELVAAVENAKRVAVNRYANSSTRIRRGLSCPCVKRWSALMDAGLYYPSEFAYAWEDTDEARRFEAAGWDYGVAVDSWVYHAYRFSRLATDVDNKRGAARDNFYAKYGDAETWLQRHEDDCNRMLSV